MNDRSDLYVGLMSGTSGDGIDAALVRIQDVEGASFELVAFETTPFPDDLRHEILAVCDPRTGTVDRICRLDAVLGEWFAQAVLAVVKAGKVEASDIQAVGSHGQTIHHLPEEADRFGVPARATLQIGNASVIAERTGIRTVSDFRSRDVAVGGQGAPLVPLVDYLLFRSGDKGRVLVNIGGITNVTVLPPGCGPDDVMAFDTGPGNVIIDGLVSSMTEGKQAFDRDGKIAAGAAVHRDLLNVWMAHPYFEQSPPRSTGREMFGAPYIHELIDTHSDVGLPDLIATATAFTAESLAQSLRCYAPDFDRIHELYVSGGGSANPVLMDEIRRRTGLSVRVTDDLGMSAEAKEAVSFAILAHRTLNNLPGNLPSATGARRAVVLGHVTP